MRKIHQVFLICFLNLNFGFAQSKSEIDYLLNEIAETKDSKEITETIQALEIIAYGGKVLPILTEFFIDSTPTSVKSECQNRNLTKGEIAIILADKVERMPYALLMGVRNCLLEFCENNPNLIEYYLPWINRDGALNFKVKYINWLSKDWIKRAKGEKRRERKKIIREWKINQ